MTQEQAQHTPGPWTIKPGRFWICNVGNNPDDPGVWSAYPVREGESFPFGDKAADAHLIAAAPELLKAAKLGLARMTDELKILLSNVCLLDANLQPIRDTCEDPDEVDALEADIAAAHAAIAKAAGQ